MTPEQLAATHRAAFAHDRPWTAAEFAALLPDAVLAGDARSFVLGRVVLDEAEILTLATHPDHRRQGLAALALTAFEAAIRLRGARFLHLEVAEDNTPARALYARAGFAQIACRRGYYSGPKGPVDALLLVKQL